VHIPDTKTRLFITFAWAIGAHLIVPRLCTLYYAITRSSLSLTAARRPATGTLAIRSTLRS